MPETDKISCAASSSCELKRLSGEVNQRITQEVDGLMSSDSMQFQRAINEAIKEQVLPQIRASFMSLNEQQPQKGWNFPAERPERKSENASNRNIRCSSRDELPQSLNDSDDEDETHDMVTGVNEAPNPIPEFFTGLIPSRTALNRNIQDRKDSLDTNIPAPEQNTPTSPRDLIHMLADVLTNLQNR